MAALKINIYDHTCKGLTDKKFKTIMEEGLKQKNAVVLDTSVEECTNRY